MKKRAIELLKSKKNISTVALAKALSLDIGQTRKILKKITAEELLNLKPKKKEEKLKPFKKTLIIGKIEGHKDGFAFFIPDDRAVDDVFIHPKNLSGAIHGDTVAVQVAIFRGRKEAIVEKIIKRGMKQVVGIAEVSRRRVTLIPFSRNFTVPLSVIGERSDVKDDDVLICDIHTYPSSKMRGEVRIIRKLGNFNDIGVDNEIVIAKYDLDREFPDDVDAEAKLIEEDKFKISKKGLTDFKDIFSVTIDGDTAKDYDDAISVSEDDGKLTLYVHIADVSRYVTRGSAIDREAKRRGTSVYFPQFAIPMLPEALSNGKCSLLPNEDRYTVTAKILFNDRGERISTSFYRSVIRSSFRLTYSYVNKLLSGDEKADSKELSEFLIPAEKLANILKERRKREGGLDFDLPEAEFIFDKNGRIADIKPSERGFAEQMIEFFMISANESVAEYLDSNKIPALYRTHGDPDPKKVEAWIAAAKEFGLDVPEASVPFTTDDIRAFGLIASGSKYSNILSSLLVRSMMRAEYTTDNTGHFGLASGSYTHFTSPIRRYPDLLVHRALLDSLKLGPLHEGLDELKILAGETSRLERAAEESEGDISTFKKLEYLRAHKDDTFEGYINRITPQGVFIYLEKIMMVGFVDFTTIDPDRYTVVEGVAYGKNNRDKMAIGDKIFVTLLRVDISQGRAEFELATAG